VPTMTRSGSGWRPGSSLRRLAAPDKRGRHRAINQKAGLGEPASLSSLIVSVSEFCKMGPVPGHGNRRVYRNQDRSVPTFSHPASFGEGRLLTCATHYKNLFDNLVSADNKRVRHGHAKGLGGFEIKDKFEFRRLRNRNAAGAGWAKFVSCTARGDCAQSPRCHGPAVQTPT
jgi:hypothetical protein